MSMISYIDNVFFKLYADGIFGYSFLRKAERVEKIRLKRRKLKKGEVSVQTIIVGLLVLTVYALWGWVAFAQSKGLYFVSVYPRCELKDSYLKVGNGVCNEVRKYIVFYMAFLTYYVAF